MSFEIFPLPQDIKEMTEKEIKIQKTIFSTLESLLNKYESKEDIIKIIRQLEMTYLKIHHLPTEKAIGVCWNKFEELSKK